MYSQNFITNYLFFIFQIGLIISIAFFLVKILHRSLTFGEKIIAFSVYCYGTIVISMTFLGTLGILSYPYLLYTLIAIDAALLFFIVRKKIPLWEKNSFSFSFFPLIVYVPLFALLFVKIINALLSPVIETDSLVYHLPFAAEWFQTHSLWAPYYTAYAGPLGYYPANYELLSLFTFFPFREDVLVNLVNFSLFLPLGIVIYRLATLLGKSFKEAAAAPALLLFMPMVLRQGGIPQNDIFFMFTLASAFYFTIKNYKSDSWDIKNLLPLAISLGLFIGTKSTGIVYGGLFTIVVITLIILSQRRRYKYEIMPIIFIFIVLVASGGFWYIRNWIVAKNPLFPLHIGIGTGTLFQGASSFLEQLKDSALITHVNVSTVKTVIKNIFLSTGAFGFLGIISCVIGAWRIFQKDKRRALTVILIIAIFISGFLYLITPFGFSNIYPNIRYLIPFFVIGCILFLHEWKWRGLFLIASLGIANFLIIAYQENFLDYINDYVFYHLTDLFVHPYLALMLLIAALFLAFFIFIKNKIIKLFSLACALIFIGLLLNESFLIREKNPFDRFIINGTYIYNKDVVEAFRFVDRSLPKNATIAFTRAPAHYPLFGKHWERRVSYVNINECFDCRYHDYKKSPRSILRDPNFENWFANLTKAKKEYLFIGLKEFGIIPPYELLWAKEHPQKFTLVFENASSAVYRIQ